MFRKVALLFLVIFALVVASVGAVVAYFVSALFTGLIVINLLVSAIAYGIICFYLTRIFAGGQAVGHAKRVAANESVA